TPRGSQPPNGRVDNEPIFWKPSVAAFMLFSEGWRRPFGAGEDRNLGGRAGHLGERRVAPALRGWRGSQHRRAAVRGPSRDRWRRPFGAGEDRNHVGLCLVPGHRGGGAGPSGLARIATCPSFWLAPSECCGAGPSGLARIATPDTPPHSRPPHVAPALRGWRGSQLTDGALDRTNVAIVAPALRGWRGSQP